MPLWDEYFEQLMIFSDPSHHISFAENFGARTLHCIRMAAMAMTMSPALSPA